jgi:glycosyltransferase involved in cell wall biosynthesis
MVHNTYQQPGGEDVVFRQERRLLEEHGHTVVGYERNNFEVEDYTGLSRLSLVRRTIWNGEVRAEFAQLLEREKPDLVHVHNTFTVISPSIYSACHQQGVPVVQTLHNFRLFCPAATFFRDGHVCEDCVDKGLIESVKHSCYRGSVSATAATALMLAVHRYLGTWESGIDAYINLTRFSRDRCVRAGLPAGKVFVKPNFVHPDPGGGSHNGDYAIFAGRLSPKERITTIFEALERLASLSLNLPVWIVGGGPERGELEADAARRKLSNIVFTGQLTREETIRAIGNARFLIFSSHWYENFPLTIVESFACGVPVICSKLGAMQEIVEDGRTGVHFAPGDGADLACKLESVLRHPQRIREMGNAARREYQGKYTAKQNYQQLMTIYLEALARRGKQIAPESKDPIPQYAFASTNQV